MREMLCPKVVYWGFVFSWILCVLACSDQKPSSNTIEYRVAHGLSSERENKILIGGHTFIIPVDEKFDVYTQGDIQEGKADVLTVYMNSMKNAGETSARQVRVEYRYFKPIENVSESNYNQPMFKSTNRQFYKRSHYESIGIPLDNGLMEYRSNKIERGWGKVAYTVARSHPNNHLQQDLDFKCNSSADFKNYTCETGLEFKNTLRLWIFIPGELMGDWDLYVNKAMQKAIKLTKNK